MLFPGSVLTTTSPQAGGKTHLHPTPKDGESDPMRRMGAGRKLPRVLRLICNQGPIVSSPKEKWGWPPHEPMEMKAGAHTPSRVLVSITNARFLPIARAGSLRPPPPAPGPA